MCDLGIPGGRPGGHARDRRRYGTRSARDYATMVATKSSSILSGKSASFSSVISTRTLTRGGPTNGVRPTRQVFRHVSAAPPLRGERGRSGNHGWSGVGAQWHARESHAGSFLEDRLP